MTNKHSDVRRYQNPVVEDPKYVGENQSKNRLVRETGKAGNFEKGKHEKEKNFDPQTKKKTHRELQIESFETKKTNR